MTQRNCKACREFHKKMMARPLTDNCFRCGKEVTKPEGSPKDRKRWVDRCEECLAGKNKKWYESKT